MSKRRIGEPINGIGPKQRAARDEQVTKALTETAADRFYREFQEKYRNEPDINYRKQAREFRGTQ